jgi:hypothetical protein
VLPLDCVATTMATRENSIDYLERMNDLIIFTHEYELVNQSILTKLEDCCEYAIANGYHFDFPMNKILS